MIHKGEVPRLTLEYGEDLDQGKKEEQVHHERTEEMYNKMEEEWTNDMLYKRDKSDIEKRGDLGRATKTTIKKRKFNLAGEDWGMVGQDREIMDRFLYSTAEMSSCRTDRVHKQ